MQNENQKIIQSLEQRIKEMEIEASAQLTKNELLQNSHQVLSNDAVQAKLEKEKYEKEMETLQQTLADLQVSKKEQIEKLQHQTDEMREQLLLQISQSQQEKYQLENEMKAANIAHEKEQEQWKNQLQKQTEELDGVKKREEKLKLEKEQMVVKHSKGQVEVLSLSEKVKELEKEVNRLRELEEKRKEETNEREKFNDNANKSPEKKDDETSVVASSVDMDELPDIPIANEETPKTVPVSHDEQKTNSTTPNWKAHRHLSPQIFELVCAQLQPNDNSNSFSSFEELKSQYMEINKEKIKLARLYESEKSLSKTSEMQCNLHKDKFMKCKKEYDQLQQKYQELQNKFDNLENTHVQFKLDYANLSDKYSTLQYEMQKFQNNFTDDQSNGKNDKKKKGFRLTKS